MAFTQPRQNNIGNTLFLNDSKIGIGVTDPDSQFQIGVPNRGDGETSELGKLVVAGPISTPTNDFTNSTAIFRIIGTDSTNNLQMGIGGSGDYSHNPWIQASYDNTDVGGPDTGNKDLLLNPLGGFVGIGQTNPDTTLHVSGTDTVNMASHYGFLRNHQTETGDFTPGAGGVNFDMCARFDGRIAALETVFAGGSFGVSDERIKTNFNELDDYQCLSQVRQIKPYTYNFIDTSDDQGDTVIGFKAQEIKKVISGVVKTKKGFIPNIYKKCDIVSVDNESEIKTTVITISDISSYGLEVGSRLKIIEYIYNDDKLKTHEVPITDISGENVTIETTFTTTFPIIDVFVYGKEVDDFHYIGQNRITPVLTSALQEIDRRVVSHFTGSHTCYKEDNTLDFTSYIGLIVVSNSNYKITRNGTTTTGKDAIKIDHATPQIKLSNIPNQKSILGVVNRIEDDTVLVNSVGEGGIWVCSKGDDFECGDYITTCDIPGYGVKQTDDLHHNYTVAKITCNVNFDDVSAFENKTIIHNSTTYTVCFVGCTYHCG